MKNGLLNMVDSTDIDVNIWLERWDHMASKPAKYIIWDDGLNDCAIVFNNHLTHADIAHALNITPISAGFVEFNAVPHHFGPPKTEVVVSGGSVSLHLVSKSGDALTIERALKING